MSTLLTPIEAFCSFAEADAVLLERLELHPSALRHEGRITIWHKRRIAAGKNWSVELDQHLDTASLILLLISPDFLASDYLYGVELQRAMERHQTNEAHVIPILLRSCDWTGTPFELLQVIPRNRKPIALWRDRDAGFGEVAKEIRSSLEERPQTTMPNLNAHRSTGKYNVQISEGKGIIIGDNAQVTQTFNKMKRDSL